MKFGRLFEEHEIRRPADALAHEAITAHLDHLTHHLDKDTYMKIKDGTERHSEGIHQSLTDAGWKGEPYAPHLADQYQDETRYHHPDSDRAIHVVRWVKDAGEDAMERTVYRARFMAK